MILAPCIAHEEVNLPRARDSTILIRSSQEQDRDGVWVLLETVFRAGETYAIPLDISQENARRAWTVEPQEVCVTVDEVTGRIVGTYYLRPNHEGRGAHVRNCGNVVAEDARGRGIASLMCGHSQEEATARGYRAMQFNLVAASNEGAVRLWQELGFEIVGTLPGAFRDPRYGFVAAHVMYKLQGAAAGWTSPAGDASRDTLAAGPSDWRERKNTDR